MVRWKGEQLLTVGELLDAAVTAYRKEGAQEFLAAYRQANPENADANLGYIIGYLEPAALRRRMYAAYGVKHPVTKGTV